MSNAIATARSCFRAFLVTSVLLLGGTFFAITGGPPTRAEVNELNGAYAGVLSHVESTAHTLRSEVCSTGADCDSAALHSAKTHRA